MRTRRPTGSDRFSHGHAAPATPAAPPTPAPADARAASAAEAALAAEAEQPVTATRAGSNTATKPATNAIPRKRSLTGSLAERNSFTDGLPIVGRLIISHTRPATRISETSTAS
jgi:hypothetical protein